MTAKKDFKRRVRARQERTGESYTTARRHVVAERAPASAASPPPPAAPPSLRPCNGGRAPPVDTQARAGELHFPDGPAVPA